MTTRLITIKLFKQLFEKYDKVSGHNCGGDDKLLIRPLVSSLKQEFVRIHDLIKYKKVMRNGDATWQHVPVFLMHVSDRAGYEYRLIIYYNQHWYWEPVDEKDFLIGNFEYLIEEFGI